ncbi:MAG: 50S ribosomal protein L24 [Chloroflexi bacterium]|nr:50S ribosomal protein L24 [Chloroflexota bacterium]
MASKLRTGDTVLVIAGKDRGQKGKVRRVIPEERRAVVEGLNMVKRHLRGRPGVRQAGIIEREAPISLSNLMLLCPRCNKPARVGAQFLEDGRKVRRCRACGEVVE